MALTTGPVRRKRTVRAPTVGAAMLPARGAALSYTPSNPFGVVLALTTDFARSPGGGEGLGRSTRRANLCEGLI
jgi:hypothetical protein